MKYRLGLYILFLALLAGGCGEAGAELPADASVVPDYGSGPCPSDIVVNPDLTDPRPNVDQHPIWGGTVYGMKVLPTASDWTGTQIFEHTLAADGQEPCFDIVPPVDTPPCPFDFQGGDQSFSSCGSVDVGFTVGDPVAANRDRYPGKFNHFWDTHGFTSEAGGFNVLGEYNMGEPEPNVIPRCRVGCIQDYACNRPEGEIVGDQFLITLDLIEADNPARTDVEAHKLDPACTVY